MPDAASTTGSLSQDDVHTIQGLLIEMTSEALGNGMLTLLASMTLYTLLCNGLQGSVPRWSLFAAVIILVLSTMITFSSDLAFCLKEITRFGSLPVSPGLLVKLMIPGTVCARVNYLISDSIVVWRAWALTRGRIFRIVLVLCILTTLGLMIPECYFTLLPFVEMTPDDKYLLNLLATAKPPGGTIMMVMSIITSALTAATVTHKTWTYRAEIKEYLQQQSCQKRTEKILILLLESGSIYCAISILTLIATLTANLTESPDHQLFASVMTSLSPYISGSYAIAIILLVETGKTRDATAGSIPFASYPERSLFQSSHSTSIVQSMANHIQSKKHAENATNSAKDLDDQLGRSDEKSG